MNKTQIESADLIEGDEAEVSQENIISSQEVLDLLKTNLEMTKEIQVNVRHINEYVAWQRIFSWLKILFIVVPIVLGVIYLPPLLKDAFNQYGSLISGAYCNRQ